MSTHDTEDDAQEFAVEDFNEQEVVLANDVYHYMMHRAIRSSTKLSVRMAVDKFHELVVGRIDVHRAILLRRETRSGSSCFYNMEAPHQGYHTNVFICLINPSNKIFAASRLDIPDSWQIPQGDIHEGEDPRNAAIRALREKTGVTSVEVLKEVPYWLTYDYPPEVREKLKRTCESDWKGQAQKWFCLKLLGDDKEVNLSGDGKEKAEFGNWAWVTREQVVQRAADSNKLVYEEALRVFASDYNFYLASDCNRCSGYYSRFNPATIPTIPSAIIPSESSLDEYLDELELENDKSCTNM